MKCPHCKGWFDYLGEDAKITCPHPNCGRKIVIKGGRVRHTPSQKPSDAAG